MTHRRTSSLFILLLFLAGVAPADPGDPWPSFRGPRGDGQMVVALGDGPLALAKRWVRSLGSGYSGIAIGGGLLVTATQAGERDVVIALDPQSGDERWRYDLEPAYDGRDGAHDGPIATPAIAAGRLFMVGAAGQVAAVRLADGEEIWTRHLVDELGKDVPTYGFAGSPAVAGNVVVLAIGGEEGAAAGFDVESGEVLWRGLPDEVFCESPVVAEIGGQMQILMLTVTWVAGLDPADGTVLWQHEHQAGVVPMGALTQSVLPLDGERLFVKHGNDTTMVLGVSVAPKARSTTTVAESGFATAVLQESRGLVRSYSPPSAAGDALYGFTGRLLSAVDPATGELLWRSRQPGDGFLVAVGGQLAVLTKKGTLHLGAASKQGWSQIDQIDLFSDLAWTPPSAAGRSIYARSLGEIARVDIVAAGKPPTFAEVVVPRALEGLAAELAETDDPAAAAARFLAGKELPLIDGDHAVFLWHGAGDDVAVAGDMIGMRREEAMHRLPGTDLWWWQTELDPRARISYLFFVDDEPRVDPSHLRRTHSTVLGPDMNWQRDEGLEMSWFAMPEWPGWNSEPSAGRGHLETIEIAVAKPVPPGAAETAEAETVPMNVPVWLPPGYAESDARYPVVYVHHPRAREAGRWTETLDRVVGRTVAPVIAVFVERPPMQDPGGALAETLVPAVDGRYRTRAEAAARANVGMGFYGNDALWMTFRNPEIFGILGIQSFFGVDSQMEMLTDTVGELTATRQPLSIYLEWGKWDLVSPHEVADTRDAGRWLLAFLRRRGWQPIGGEVADSTDFASWRNRTDVLLETLFPIDGKTPPASLARWLTRGRNSSGTKR